MNGVGYTWSFPRRLCATCAAVFTGRRAAAVQLHLTEPLAQYVPFNYADIKYRRDERATSGSE